jgi:hypothetical protein
MNEKIMERDEMIKVEEDKEMMIKKFRDIKHNNNRLQKFIRGFMDHEGEFSERLRGMKIVIKTTKKIE